MLAAENSIYGNVADALYYAMAEENKREACRRYEERKAVEARLIREMQEAKAALVEKDAYIAKLEKAIEALKK